MGNSSTAQGKGSTTGQNTGAPAWSKVGSTAYNNMNNMLQTGPMNAFNQTLAQGGQGAATQNAIQGMQGNNGTNQWMNSAANSLQNVGQITPGGQVGTQNYQNIANQAGQGGAANQYLTGTAQGDYLNGSPYLDSIVNKSNQNIADQTNQMFASGGRYGSGANQGVIADSIGSNTNNLLNANYQSERDRQMNAANSLESAQQGRMGIGLNAAGGIAGAQGQNIANNMNAQSQNSQNQLGAAGALGNLGQSQFQNQFNNLTGAAGLENQGFQNMLGMISQLPTIQNNKVFDAQQQMGVGGQLDTATQNQLNDLIKQWGQTDMQDWARLGGLLSAGTTAAGSWGTQTQNTTQPSNPLGLLGSLLGGIKFSDRRLKDEIRHIGELPNGIPVYEFHYKWDMPDDPFHIGVMADEVREIRPEAVLVHENGFAMVDYDQVI